MSTQVSSATVAVFPTFKGFRAATESETRSAGQSGGKAFDSAFKAATANTAANVTKGLEVKVRTASQALSKARLAEADALGRTRTAQAAYNESLTKYGAGSARAISAEERLAAARRRSDEATAKVTVESNRLKTAQSQLADATTKAGAAGEKGANQFVRGWQSVKGKLTGILKPAVDDASAKAAAAADDGGRKAGLGFLAGFKGMMGGLALLGAGTAITGFLKSSVTEASDLAESTNKMQQVFKDATPAVVAFASKGAASLGLTEVQARNAAATMGIFGKSAGLAGEPLAKFSTDMTGLAVDLASFHNTSPEEAIDALGSALRGEAEPMRKYGVLLDDASMRQQALAMGLIATTKQALTPQQKVLAAQALIMKQTGDAQGDFARTSEDLANQQRILSAQFTDLKGKVGNLFLPVLTRLAQVMTGSVMPALSGSVDRLAVLGEGIRGLATLLNSGDYTGALRKAFGIEEDSPIVGLLFRVRDAIIGIFAAVGPLLASVSPLGMLVRAFVDIGPVMATAMETGTGFGDVFTQLIGNLAGGASTLITNVAQLLVTLLPTLVTGLSQYLPGIITTLAGSVTVIVQQLAVLLPTLIPILVQAAVGLFMALVQAVPLVIPPLIEGVVALLNSLVVLLPALIPVLLQAAVALLMAIVQAVPIILPPLLQGAIDLIMAVMDALPTLIPALLDASVALLTAIVDAIPVILPMLLSATIQLIAAVVSMLQSLIPRLLAAAVTLFMAIVRAVPTLSGALSGVVGGLIGDAIGEVARWGGRMLESGKALIGGFVNGIKSGFTNALNAVRSGLDQIRSFFPFSPAKRGPFSGSGYTDRSGKALMTDFAQAIEDTGRDAVNATATVLGRVQGQFSSTTVGALGSGSGAAAGPAGAVAGAGGAASPGWADLASELRAALEGVTVTLTGADFLANSVAARLSVAHSRGV